MEPSGKDVVRRFFDDVRTSKQVARAHELMAARVLAHQLNGEAPSPTIVRTPTEYIRHVAELDEAHGGSHIVIEELFGEGDKVYVRWRQSGTRAATLASAVYRVEDGRIREYWMQIVR